MAPLPSPMRSRWAGERNPATPSATRRAGAILVLAAGLVHAQSPQTPATTTGAARKPTDAAMAAVERVLPLEVVVNGTKFGTWLLLERQGELYAPRDAFDEWRLQLPTTTQTVKYRGTQYLPLTAIPGFTAKVNFANQSVELTFSPQAFAATRLTMERNKKPVVSPVLTSAFFNYDLSYSVVSPRSGSGSRELGALTELGVSNSWGVLSSSAVGRNLTGNSDAGQGRSWLRLETTFTRDLPARNQTLRAGDSSTRAGMWGRSVYFGGLQWGTNFGLTPGFISQPLPILSGVSASPSTVELYINDVLRQVSNVPTGPFAIENLPALTGGGEARLVVRDVLGRQTVISQPFFTNSQLLAKGLDDWSTEVGALRQDLGMVSNHYGPAFASGIWRRGWTNDLTMEARAEITRRSQDAGIGLVTTLPLQTLGKAAVVASRSAALGSGHELVLGLERQTLRNGAYFQVQRASPNFRQLGEESVVNATKLQVAGNITYTTERWGTVGAGFASVSRYGADRVSTVSLNYSRRIWERSNLTVTASRASNGGSGTSIGVMLVIPLEKNRVVSTTAATHGGTRDLYASAAQNPPEATGWAWRTLAGEVQSEHHAEGGVYYTGRYGMVSTEASASRTQNALRLGATGGMVLADGHLFATRRLDSSFAVAEVAGYGNVGIGLGSNVLTHTDAAGVALIPRLSAYQGNSIRIDPKELPINAEIDSIEQTVVPAWRSGVKVVFPVRSGRGALLKIVFDDGQAAPAGAVIRVEGEKEDFYVARRGEAFVTGLEKANRLILNWKDRQCPLDVALPPAAPNDIPRLGPLLCKGVPR
jgi:outer membrane usher protein